LRQGSRVEREGCSSGRFAILAGLASERADRRSTLVSLGSNPRPHGPEPCALAAKLPLAMKGAGVP